MDVGSGGGRVEAGGWRGLWDGRGGVEVGSKWDQVGTTGLTKLRDFGANWRKSHGDFGANWCKSVGDCGANRCKLAHVIWGLWRNLAQIGANRRKSVQIGASGARVFSLSF